MGRYGCAEVWVEPLLRNSEHLPYPTQRQRAPANCGVNRLQHSTTNPFLLNFTCVYDVADTINTRCYSAAGTSTFSLQHPISQTQLILSSENDPLEGNSTQKNSFLFLLGI